MNCISTLVPVDRLEVHILVDNTTDGLSRTLPDVENEFSLAARRGTRMLSSRCLCCAVHGLSCLITSYQGDRQHTILFDTGPEEGAFERNTSRLDVDLGRVDAIVLSHGHWDHTGAALWALDAIQARNGHRQVPCYAHPDMFHSRGVRMADGSVWPMDDVPSPAALIHHGARVICTTEPQDVLDGMFHISGEIPRVTSFERGLPGHVRRTTDSTDWEPDELLLDERWMAVQVRDKGLVVFSACSHAGIINVLEHAQQSFPGVPLYAAMGGFHLAGPNEAIIEQTIDALRGFELGLIGAGHCTGWRGISALYTAFGDHVVAPTSVGKRFVF